MTYAVKQDMIDRFGEREVIALTDRSNAGVIDNAVLNNALAAADDEINPYLDGKVVLPLASVPNVLKGYACDIARYRLCGSDVVETDNVTSRYNYAIRFLEKVAAGKIRLGLNSANEPAPAQNTVQFKPGTRVFGRDNTENA